MESLIQQSIISYLGYLERSGKGYFFRNNSFAGHIMRRNQSVGYVQNNKRGTPDICGVYLGKFIGIEVKGPKGYLSKDQREAKERIEKAGGIYILARSIDDVEKVLHDL